MRGVFGFSTKTQGLFSEKSFTSDLKHGKENGCQGDSEFKSVSRVKIFPELAPDFSLLFYITCTCAEFSRFHSWFILNLDSP